MPPDRGRGTRTVVGFDPEVVLGRFNEAKPFVSPHQQFLERLQEALLRHAPVHVVAADVGRGPAGLVWLITLELGNGALLNLQAPAPPNASPYSLSLADDMARRIIAYLDG